MIKEFMLFALLTLTIAVAGWLSWRISIEFHDALHARLELQEKDNE